MASKNFDTVSFYHTPDQELIDYYEAKIVLLKTFDEGRNDFDEEVTFDNIVEWLNKHRYATVMEFDDDSQELIIQGKKKTLFLFKADNEEGDRALEEL